MLPAGPDKEAPAMPRLLLDEDNEENRDGLSRHLRRKGLFGSEQLLAELGAVMAAVGHGRG